MEKQNKIETLFIDIEWNQKSGTNNVEGREPIQIGMISATASLEMVRLFSKGIRLDSVTTLTEETCKLTHMSASVIMMANPLDEVFHYIEYCRTLLTRL